MLTLEQAARRFRDDIASALQPGRWRGGPEGADGVTKDEVIEDVATALERFDEAVKDYETNKGA